MKINTLITNTKAHLANVPEFLKVLLNESLAGYLASRPKPGNAAVFIKYWALTLSLIHI